MSTRLLPRGRDLSRGRRPRVPVQCRDRPGRGRFRTPIAASVDTLCHEPGSPARRRSRRAGGRNPRARWATDDGGLWMAEERAWPDDPAGTAERDFERFVLDHTRELGRLSYLLLGNPDEADDLTADVLLACWKQWDVVQAADHPMAYLRRMAANMAASRIRRLRLARAKLPLFRTEAALVTAGPDGSDVDVRDALARLPPRRRACVVMRLAFGLSEREVADSLGVSLGTVKSQTHKGVRQLQELLAEGDVRALESPAPGDRHPGSGDLGATR
jgi:RNA polymerase sigma-70 factor (sigma-E family)